MEALHIGDVFRIGSGRRAGWAVVVQPARSWKGEWSGPVVVTEDKHLHTVSLNDVTGPVAAVTRIKVPPHVNPKNDKMPVELIGPVDAPGGNGPSNGMYALQKDLHRRIAEGLDWLSIKSLPASKGAMPWFWPIGRLKTTRSFA